jgi:hypothetical protein
MSFLTIVLSGFHLHADVGGHDATVSHAQDLHQVVDLEHELDNDHVDISVFEPARGFAQVDTVFPAATGPELLVSPAVDVRWSKDAPDIISWRYSRLRPALRAPPVSA